MRSLIYSALMIVLMPPLPVSLVPPVAPVPPDTAVDWLSKTPATKRHRASWGAAFDIKYVRLVEAEQTSEDISNIWLKFTNGSSFQSITRKSLPAKRKTASFALKKTNTPGPASVLLNEDVTPRNILSNILRTGICNCLPHFKPLSVVLFNHEIYGMLQSP